MVDGGTVALAAKRFDAATRQAVDRTFLQSIACFRRSDGAYAIPSEFVIASGQKPTYCIQRFFTALSPMPPEGIVLRAAPERLTD
jgi:hypothetical protein